VSTDVSAEAVLAGGRWIREVRLGSTQAGGWRLIAPGDLPAPAAWSRPGHPLVTDLVTDLNGVQPGQERPDGLPVPRLIRAVANADAASFAAAAAALTQASVTVVDRDGTVIASSAGPAPKGTQAGRRTRDIVLRDDTGLRGAIRLTSGWPAPAHADELLGDLGLALVKAIDSERRRGTLESQLVILGCLAGRDAGRLFRRDFGVPGETPRRLVVISAPQPIAGHAGARLRDQVIRAAARTQELADLCLVLSDGWLLGVYPDNGCPLARQRKSWTAVLGAVEAVCPLMAAVGALVSDIEDFRLQYRVTRDIAKLQQGGSRYFDLPSVVVLDDLGPLAEVLGVTPGREFVPFVERVLGDLLDDQRFGGQLIDTLHAYLQTSGSPREAGALLHLHPSTVKYRIRVIRERLGARLEDQTSRFDLELAVRLCLAARQLRKKSAG
jgi:PucR C-terminal helix-turn-helix domain